MKDPKGRLITVWTLGCSILVLSGLLVTLYAQDDRSQTNPAADSISSRGSVGTVSASKSKVTLKLAFDNGSVFKVTQFMDRVIRVERNGSAVAIVAHMDTRRIDQVVARIYKLLPEEAGGEPLGESIGELRLSSIGNDSAEASPSNLGFRLQVIRLSLESDVEGTIKLSSFRPFDGGGECTCCVTCNGIRVCGCAVEGDCGSCCCGTCCGGGGLL